MTTAILLVYYGDPHHPERRGTIEGVTPLGSPADGIPPGLEEGSNVVIDDALLESLNRPTGESAAKDFAEFLANVYNVNYPYVKWGVEEVDLTPPAAEVPPTTAADAPADEPAPEPPVDTTDQSATAADAFAL